MTNNSLLLRYVVQIDAMVDVLIPPIRKTTVRPEAPDYDLFPAHSDREVIAIRRGENGVTDVVFVFFFYRQ